MENFPGVYELWTMTSQNYVHRGIKQIKDSMETCETEDSVLCGCFKSTFGPIGSSYYLWRHKNFDQASDLRLQWLSNSGTYVTV